MVLRPGLKPACASLNISSVLCLILIIAITFSQAYTSVIVAVHCVFFFSHLGKFFLFPNLATHTKHNLNSTITCSLYFFCRDIIYTRCGALLFFSLLTASSISFLIMVAVSSPQRCPIDRSSNTALSVIV